MIRMVAAALFALIACCGAGGQLANPPAFEVASVKPSKASLGQDGSITTGPDRFTARNVTLKRLVYEAWQVPYSQIVGGPGWFGRDEYDIDAKAESPANMQQLRAMLQTLLIDRFKLAVRPETKEGKVYVLEVAKGGPKLGGATDGSSSGMKLHVHGNLSKFADYVSIGLTAPMSDDLTVPNIASGPAVPVVNRTGIDGTYDLNVTLKPDRGADTFTTWQRALEEQLGLKLESSH
ncbi:MAG TPA: TIGR03435 family protein, partial [Acidobacteriaceae bacterium]|nr:TIGR03435 family protein [Acidobacteriaceae bacterium]